MSRPLGSKNKPKLPKNTGGLEVIKFEKQVEGSAISRDSKQGYIKWGAKNDYPQLLLNLYNQSPTHHAAINFGVQSIIQNGLDYNAMQLDGTQTYPNAYYSWDTLIRYIALDYLIYGSYAIQIIKNKDNKTFSFYHIPMEKVRCSPYDEDGQITSYWISSDWSQVSMYPPFQIEAIDMRDENVIEKGKPYIYVLKTYDPTVTYYQSPLYSAGIKAIQSECEYVNYDLKHIINGFSTAGILTLPDVETDEQKRAIINNIQQMFQGSDNTNQIAITFRTNIEDKPVEWTPFADGKNGADKYDSANNRTISRILSAHQIPSPMLIGQPDMSNAGFSSDADKIEMAYQLYQKLTGNYHREQVIKSLNDMFKLNGIDVEIVQKPLHFNNFDESDNNNSSSETVARDVEQDVDADNIEEKVDGNNNINKQ